MSRDNSLESDNNLPYMQAMSDYVQPDDSDMTEMHVTSSEIQESGSSAIGANKGA
jgi:hypothetical protein